MPVLEFYNKKKLKIIKRAISNKSIWIVGSSFLEDEQLAVYTQKLLIKRNVRKLLVLVPRFPERAYEILNLLKDFEVKVYSKGEIPDVKTDIFVVDSIGELGLWYKASEVALIGGTFSNVEGKNPWEALHLDCVIAFGPRHSKFNNDFNCKNFFPLPEPLIPKADFQILIYARQHQNYILTLKLSQLINQFLLDKNA